MGVMKRLAGARRTTFAAGDPRASVASVAGIKMLVGIEGIRETAKAMEGFHPTLKKKILRKVVRKAARPVLEAARARAPVDTGALEETLSIRSAQFGRGRFGKNNVGAKVVTAKRERLGIDPDDKGYYPAVIEFGRKDGTIPAQPYLRPALDDASEEVRYIYRNELSRLIDETVSQLYHGKIDERGRKVKS